MTAKLLFFFEITSRREKLTIDEGAKQHERQSHSFLQLHPVRHAATCATTFETILGTLQEIADFLEDRRVLLVIFEVALQQGGYLFQRHPLAVFILSWPLNDRQQHLAQSVQLLVLKVVLHQLLLLFLGQPVTLALVDFMAQLGIERVVLDGCLEIDVAVDVHADETACAGGVGEGHLLVGGADE